MSDEPRQVPPEWTPCQPAHLPRPDAAPALFGFGAMLFAWGLVSSLVVTLIGAAVLVAALLHWIGDIRNDAR